MASFQGVNSGGQLQQQLASAARRQNTTPAATSAPPGASNEAASGNALPPIAAKVEFSEPVAKEKQIQEAVAKLSDFVQSVQRDLSFSVDDATGDTIITVIDSKTNEVIRQIPSEYVVRLAQNLNELQEALSSADGSKGNLLEIRV